LSASDRSYHER